MMIRRSKRAAERLDAFLEGRSGGVPEELASLAEAAEELRAEARALELDRGVASTHVAAALHALQQAPASPEPAPAPVRQAPPPPPRRWRLQFGVALAGAALLMVPATLASARALPGDVLYPVKRGVEQVRLVAATSPQAEAETRTQIAQERLGEVRALLDGGRWERVPAARQSLDTATADAMDAVAAARLDGAEEDTVAALESELAAVPEEEEAVVAMTLDRLPPEEAETVRALIVDPDDGGTGGFTGGETPATEPSTPGGGGTPTPSMTPTPSLDTSTSTSSTTSSTTTSTTTTSTTTTSTTTTTLPPEDTTPTPSGSPDAEEDTPLP